MLFRLNNGTLTDIRREYFLTDSAFYLAILKTRSLYSHVDDNTPTPARAPAHHHPVRV